MGDTWVLGDSTGLRASTIVLSRYHLTCAGFRSVGVVPCATDTSSHSGGNDNDDSDDDPNDPLLRPVPRHTRLDVLELVRCRLFFTRVNHGPRAVFGGTIMVVR